MPPEWTTYNRKDVPKILRPLIKRIVELQSYPLIRLCLSVLFSTRSLRLEPEPSFKTIEDGPSYKYENATHLREDMVKFLKSVGVNTLQLGRKPKKLNFSEFHMTSKSGPNGHALWTSFLDWKSLTDTQKECIREVGGDKLSDLAQRHDQLVDWFPDFFLSKLSPRKGTMTTRKLVCIQDKEGKTREVAILDYWSQSALRPLHEYQLRFLSRISQDCTKNQTKWFRYLTAKRGNSYWSIDLTAATDRFPMMIQHQFLEVWFGRKYADAWNELMVGTPFAHKGRLVNYNVGNPMGAYSSFNSFAICHHFMVYLACKSAGVNWKQCPYMLLGDDIVIAHDEVAKEYITLLKTWGLTVSKQKTHTSKHAFEFAKQIRLHGQNVSHFPISALFDRRSETFTSAGIIANEVWNKDWVVDIHSSLKNYFIHVLGWKRPRFRAFAPTLYLSISILGYLKGRARLGTAITEYVSLKTGSKYQMDPWIMSLFANYLLIQLLHTTFLKSRERVTSTSNKKPLGELAVDMVCLITSLDEQRAGTAFSNIEAVPFLQIYGRAEETWLNLNLRMSVYQVGQSPLKFRKMFDKINIPGSDADFYTRHRDIVMIQAAHAAKHLGRMIFEIAHLKDDRIDLDVKVPWNDHIKVDKSDQYRIDEVNG